MRPIALSVLFLVLGATLAVGATLTGTIYNEKLNPEQNVLLEANTIPLQKFLSKDGTYSFILPPGTYTLTAEKGDLLVSEEVVILGDGKFVYDLFLLPDLTEEGELLNESEQNLIADFEETPRTWAYVAAGIITLILLWRIVRARRKYGPLPSIWRRKKKEEKEGIPPSVSTEMGDTSLEDAVAILRKHDGRIMQKDLRKEMLHLSEAKVSLIVTELEHKGRVEKIKKGRGNVLILKG